MTTRRGVSGPGDQPTPANDDVCVIVPMHNEATVIGRVVEQLRRSFPHVVCVDDGSTDASADVARAADATVLRHAINLGQGAALQTGLRHGLAATSAAYFVTFDADGQHDPDDAVRMVEVARAGGVDVVLGSRFLGTTHAMPGPRRLLLRSAVLFTRLTTGLRLTDTHNGLRVLTREAARGVDIRLSGMAHASELLEHVSRRGLRFREVPVDVTYSDYSRSKGQSGLNAVNIVVDLFMRRVYAGR
jgi:glycosyltransferase involved in cell wall biosynthesis